MIDLQTPEHRHHLHAVRRVLEAEAAGRAALTITSEQLAEATAVLEGVRRQVFADQIPDHVEIMEADAAFHRIVARASENGALAALKQGDPDRARLLMSLDLLAIDGDALPRRPDVHDGVALVKVATSDA